MDSRKILYKLEQDLSHFLIGEFCKGDPAKRLSSEMYRYKGLNITIDPMQKTQEKTIQIRIGALEASFKINNCEKSAGCLAPEEERLISIWMAKSENYYYIQSIFKKKMPKKQIAIVPFDLEHYFYDESEDISPY